MYKDGNGKITLKDRCTLEQESSGLLETVYVDGNFVKTTKINDIRELINSQNSEKAILTV